MFVDVGNPFLCLSLIPTEKEEESNKTTTRRCFLNNSCNHQSHPNGMVLMIYIIGMD
jgi:hypothetical protein